MSQNVAVLIMCLCFDLVLLIVVEHLQDILDYVHESEALYIPGVMTPTEVSI